MENKHTLGQVEVKAGEILTFTYDDSTPANRRHITVVALSDINLSAEMAAFYQSLDRTTDVIYTENSIVALIEHLCEKRLLHVGNEVSVHMGSIGRPSTRLANEYRFSLNPESYWEEKLSHRYHKKSFTVDTHQGHQLTILMGVESPFTIMADIINMEGGHLGILQLSVLSDNRHTTLDDEDVERIRSALQADISLHIEGVSALVERVSISPNPEFGTNKFINHFPIPLSTPTEKQKDTIR